MVPLFFSLGNRLKLMVIRADWTSADEPALLTNTYSIFNDLALSDPRQSKVKEASLQSEHLLDPDYFGYLSEQITGNRFTYFPCGKKELSADEVEQLIEQIKA